MKEEIKFLLWLDDIRNPLEGDWLKFSPIDPPYTTVWVKSYSEFVQQIKKNGLPDAICFDHDLGMTAALEARAKGLSKRKSRELKKLEKTGYDCAKWLVEYCMDKNLPLPKYSSQSFNPIGRENILELLDNFLKYQKQLI